MSSSVDSKQSFVEMSHIDRPSDSTGYPRKSGRHTIHYSDSTSDRLEPLRSVSIGSDFEHPTTDPERLRRERERVEREERRRESARKDVERIQRDPRREYENSEDRYRSITLETTKREQSRSERERELRSIRQRLENELDEMEQRKLSRKDRRTNSGRDTIPEPRSVRLERNLSSGLPSPMSEEPQPFISRLSRFWRSEAPARIEAPPKTKAVPKTEKSESQPKSAQTAIADLEGYFLQPAEDSFIRTNVIALSDAVDQHVYNHYGDRATGPPDDIFLKIVQVNDEDLCLPKNLICLESFRLAAVRRSIATAFIRNISVEGNPSTTFLPAEIVSLLTAAPAHSSDRFRFAASSVLRRTAANLLRLGQSGESPRYTEFKRVQVKTVSDRLHKQLSVLANPNSNDAARRDQLEAIMTKAAMVGGLLLLQPATYEFEWCVQFPTGSSFDDHEKEKSRPRQFVVFPALIRTGDSTGRELRKPQLVCISEYLDEDDLAEDGVV